jgi:hypothetical protein
VSTYPGGKNGSGVYQRLINEIPPHHAYIEPFLGSGAIMRLKRPAHVSIGVEDDIEAFSLWRGDEIPGLQLILGSALYFLAREPLLRQPDTFLYLDPPYLMSTRACQRPLYRCEFGSEAQHTALLRLIVDLPCMVMISGYHSALYADALQRWRSVSFETRTRGGTLAVEWCWMNYPAPFELHDYRYLGQDFRERERIKRKRARWRARLAAMPDLERFTILEALAELRAASPDTAMAAACGRQ